MTQRKKILALAAVVVVAGGVAAWLLLAGDEPRDRLTLYGNVEVREVVLGFRVPGRLQAVGYQEGEAVAAGSLLARLDPEPYEEEVAAAEARVAQAAAQLTKLRAGSRPQEIDRARAEVARAEAAQRRAREDHQRKLALEGTGATSQRALDAARSAREEAEAQLAAARQGLDLAREGFRSEDRDAARAELEAARARLEQTRTRLEDTALLSPTDGVVLTRIHDPGTVVGQGVPVYSLSVADPVHVRAYVAEPDLGHVVPGAAAWVTTDSSDRRYEGRVAFVSPRAEFTPRTVQTAELRTDLVYRVRIVIPGSPPGLRQGMPVTVEVPLHDAGPPPDGDGDRGARSTPAEGS